MIREIVKFPHLALMNRCTEVATEEFDTPALIDLCADIRETMEATKNGVGLAANQIGVSKRIIYIRGYGILVNPVLRALRGQRVWMEEGCLSVPDIKGNVIRHNKIEVSFTAPTGRPGDDVLTGMTARIFQHELDHLDGQMFFTKIDIVSEQKYKERIDELLDAAQTMNVAATV